MTISEGEMCAHYGYERCDGKQPEVPPQLFAEEVDKVYRTILWSFERSSCQVDIQCLTKEIEDAVKAKLGSKADRVRFMPPKQA